MFFSYINRWQSCQTALECFYILSPRYYVIMVFFLVVNYLHHCFCYRNKLILILILIQYSCSVWHPHKKSNKDKIEKVQRRAARFVSNNFRRKASVSEMLHNLGWQSIDSRRQDQRASSSFLQNY